MNIQLINFRRYENKKFSFEDGITKLSGESGIGKTTIFEAIEWCLYGKLRGVKTMKDGKVNNEKTIVSIQMNIPGLGEVQVDREGQNGVYLYIGSKGCEGIEAQTQIDKIFGVHDMFLLTSYLKAEQMHKMISASPAEKREMTSVLFPEAGKHKIYKDKTTALKRELEVEAGETKLLVQKLEGRISGIKDSNPDIEQEIPEDSGDINSLKKQMEDLQKRYNLYVAIKARYSVLREQLESLPEVQQDIEWKKSLSDIRKQKLDAVVASSTREDKISSLEQLIKDINADSLLPMEEIETQLQVCNQLLQIKIDGDVTLLQQELAEKKKLSEEYEESLECKQHNEKAKHLLKCPDCSVKLMYSGGVLVPADQTIEEKEVKHDISRKDLQILLGQISKVENQISSIEDATAARDRILKRNPQMEGKDRDILQQLKKELINMQDRYQRLQKLQKELLTLKEDTRTYLSPEENDRLTKEEKRLTQLISKNDVIKAQKESVTGQIEDLEKKEQWLERATEEIDNLQSQIKTLQEQISHLSSIDKKKKLRIQYLDFTKKLESNKIRIEEIEEEINSCSKLIGYLDECYTEYVTNKLTEIAKDVSELGKIFFDDTMNITLLPGKESSNGVLKPSFDITIEYNGKIFEDVKAMSTGEKKRISLILMMVLSKYTQGRMLLLDEALTSVSMDKRGIIMHEIDSSGLFTIVSSHDEAPGCTHELILTKQMLD